LGLVILTFSSQSSTQVIESVFMGIEQVQCIQLEQGLSILEFLSH